MGAVPPFLSVCLALFPPAGTVHAQSALELPPRPPDARTGAEIAQSVRSLDLEAREEVIFAELASGNVPSWLRVLVEVGFRRHVDGRDHRVVFRATPDYVTVGSDTNYFRVPLTPQTAQRFADVTRTSLPTTVMVDALWQAAKVRLAPAPIPPGPEMTSVRVFEDHDRTIREQRERESAPSGALIAGHKKDVVLTAKLLPGSRKVAIYGWHRLNGAPIQPLYTGHSDRWVDYSHGIRLVSRWVTIDGVDHDLLDVLRDPALAPLLSDDGVLETPRYSTKGSGRSEH